MIPGHMSQHLGDHFLLALGADEVPAFATDLLSMTTPFLDTLQV
jgi:hypothetical protein